MLIFYRILFLLCFSILFFSCSTNRLINKTFSYNVELKDSLGNTLSNEVIKLKFTEDHWDVDSHQNTAFYYYDKNSFIPKELGCGYYCFESKKNELLRDTINETGYVNSDKSFWIHPLRSNQYRFTEIAPYPEVPKKKKERFEWNSSIEIDASWCELGGISISHYTLLKNNAKKNGFKCQYVKAYSEHSEQGRSSVEYYFNNKKGLVYLKYKLIKGYVLEIDMIGE